MAEDIDIIALWEKGKSYDLNPDIDVDQTISKRSKGTLFWIRVILTIEFWINVAAIPVFTYFLLIRDKQYIWGGLAVIITLVYLFYYQFLIRQIKNFSFEDDVRTSLKKLYGYLRFFVLHYKVVLWLSLVIGLIRAFIEDVPTQVPAEKLAEPNVWLIIIGVSTFFALILGLILTGLIHLLYGRKIKRLKKLVKEFS